MVPNRPEDDRRVRYPRDNNIFDLKYWNEVAGCDVNHVTHDQFIPVSSRFADTFIAITGSFTDLQSRSCMEGTKIPTTVMHLTF